MTRSALHLISDRAALPEDFDRLLDAAYRYAVSLTHEPGEAEDLVQDAALALLRTNAEWERSYLFVTIRNRFIDRYRRNRRIAFVALEQEDGTAVDVPDLTFEVRDVLETGALDRALAQLRAEEREALFLAVVEGYTADEIGKLTARPRGTILSLLHRAKKKLRQLLGGDGGATV
ncbi:MAG TPA: RNA polymerase sigma factor [Thermoanaerobaculia bacterium]|nr:RNA polymerase sigma factor [Thermoanaerobaculia bacterium]